MKKSLIALLLGGLVGGLVAMVSHADDLPLKKDAPAHYTVVKGDTLWGISGKFLSHPWQWPQIWGMNKAEIKNPHWIYPGDIITLSVVNGQPHLSLEPGHNTLDVKLSPHVRSETLGNGAILPIPAEDIRAFAVQPFVLDTDSMKHAPRIVEYQNAHLDVTTGDKVYATSDGSKVTHWKIVRPLQAIIDPDTKQILGYSANWLGDARTIKPGDPQRLLITAASKEIQRDDRLLPATTTPEHENFRYVPHEPTKPIIGRVLSVVDIMAEGGTYNSIIINKGRADGVDTGTVLAIYHNPHARKNDVFHEKTVYMPWATDTDSVTEGEDTSRTRDYHDQKIPVPDNRIALCMVYRVFDKVSYAMIMNSTASVSALDGIKNP